MYDLILRKEAMKLPIYLDYAATTPIDPRVMTEMQRYLSIDGVFGNPSSTHVFGQAAKLAVETARTQVADLIGAEASEIIWTSGATEAINLALKGAAQLYQKKGKHIVTVKTEHLAVLDCCQYLEKNGFEVTYLTPQKNGLIDLNEFKNVLRDDTILVSIMHINNEIGVIQDIAAIGKITFEKNILLHVDAAQSAGKIPIDVNAMHIDLMSLSAHKIYGPKGIGALYLRKKPRIRVAAQMHGGGQEQGMRSGTLATHQIVGMGEAFLIAKKQMESDLNKLTSLREIFLKEISDIKIISLNGNKETTFPGILNLCIQCMPADKTIKLLPELAISAGSACGTKGKEPSYVLRALGLKYEEAETGVRISFGRFTTKDEIVLAVQLIKEFLPLKKGG